MEMLASDGISPLDVGFSSFTKVAVKTAAEKAGSHFGIEPETLTGGLFRTIHASCYHILGKKKSQILSEDKKESLEWLSRVFGKKVESLGTDGDTGFPVSGQSSEVESILSWWSYCRNSLLPISQALDCIPATQGGIDSVVRQIRRYEMMKRVDGLIDFADMPLLVAGLRHDVTEIRRVTPVGEVPEARAWILDEYQDTSPALHAAARRITSHPSVEYVWTLGDPFQSLYQFAGGHPRYLMGGFAYTSDEMMHQSHRCPPPVMALAENVIRYCSDYFDREIRPKQGDAGSRLCQFLGDNGPANRFEGSWMFLARTNFQANRIGQWLNKGGVPWRNLASANVDGGAYISYTHRRLAKAMIDLHYGREIDRDDWLKLAYMMNSHDADTPLLQPGFKLETCRAEVRGLASKISIYNLPANGGTPELAELLMSDRWDSIYKHRDKIKLFETACQTYGPELAMAPAVSVGTIHKSKGDEADNVVLYDAIPRQCRKNIQTWDTMSADEEYRVWYVGVTRARNRLVTARFRGDKVAMLRHIV